MDINVLVYISYLFLRNCQKLVIHGSPWDRKQWFGGSRTENDTTHKQNILTNGKNSTSKNTKKVNYRGIKQTFQ